MGSVIISNSERFADFALQRDLRQSLLQRFCVEILLRFVFLFLRRVGARGLLVRLLRILGVVSVVALITVNTQIIVIDEILGQRIEFIGVISRVV